MADTIVAPSTAPAEPEVKTPPTVVETSTGGVQVVREPVKEAEPVVEKPAETPPAEKPVETTPVPPVVPTVITKVIAAAEAEAALTTAGADITALAEEVITSGTLSDATVKALEAKGVARSVVDSHLAALQAEATKITTALAERAGGADEFQNALRWAATGLTEAEVKAFNTSVQTRDVNVAGLALDGLLAKMEKALGGQPARVNGAAIPPTQGSKPFGSRAEIITAMKDPRYDKDEAYRKSVERRLEVTDF